MAFKEIAIEYRYSIALILIFVLIENVSFLIEPTFFGKLLDSLIDHFYDHEKVDYIYPLIISIIVYLINVIGGTLHRLFTGKIYSIVAYLWSYIASTEYLPELMEIIASVKDLNRRFS